MKFIPILAAILLVGCAGTRAVVPIVVSEDVAAIDSSLSAPCVPPTLAEYEEARGAFVSSLENVLRTEEQRSQSSAVKVRSAIAGAGSILGIGGLVASLIVKNEDTKKSIAQASGGVAAVAGVVGLIPAGGGVEESKAVVRYLENELPHFKARWPDTMAEAPQRSEWNAFVDDSRHVEATVNALRGVE